MGRRDPLLSACAFGMFTNKEHYDVAAKDTNKKVRTMEWKARAATQLSEYHSTHVARPAALHAEHHAFVAHTLYHHKYDQLDGSF
jgi:hypothetical protein